MSALHASDINTVLSDHAETLRVLRTLSVEHNAPVWMVGGAVRDLLLGRPVKDLDVILPCERFDAVTRDLARRLRAATVPLDPDFPTLRIVPPNAPHIDISGRQGDSLQEDMLRRDFSMNAMALQLAPWDEDHSYTVFDVVNGEADLRALRIVAVSQDIIEDDPLRCVRAYRFQAALGATIDEATATLIGEEVEKLERVSMERIREELLLLLAGPHGPDALDGLHASGALRYVLTLNDAFPGAALEPPCRLLQRRQSAEDTSVEEIARASTVGGDDVVELLALALLLTANEHDPHHGTPQGKLGKALMERFKLSQQQGRLLARVIAAAHKPPPAIDAKAELDEFFWQHGDVAILGALAYDCLHPESKAPLAELLRHWHEHYAELVSARPPVTGQHLITSGQLKPGPAMGEVLRELHWRWFRGDYRDLDDAQPHIAEVIAGIS